MIPTTCGTGSVAICNAIVAVPEENSKKGIVNNEMIPDYERIIQRGYQTNIFKSH